MRPFGRREEIEYERAVQPTTNNKQFANATHIGVPTTTRAACVVGRPGRTASDMASPGTSQARSRQRTPLKRLSLYERSMQQKNDHAKRIKSMEANLLAKSCTFTPNTTKSNSSNRTATTNASSGGTESVFDRLYRNPNQGGSVASNRSPAMLNGTRLHSYSVRSSLRSSLSRSPTAYSTESRSSTAMSSRIEELYEKGVRKVRRRPVSDLQERQIRDRHREEKELDECTFRPKLYWGSKMSSKKPLSVVRNPTQILNNILSTPVKPRPRLPKEIIVSPTPHATKHRPWHTPKRQEEAFPSFGAIDFMMVSPLRDPSFDDEDEDYSRVPRIIIGSTVASASGSIAVTQTDETEYGSI